MARVLTMALWVVTASLVSTIGTAQVVNAASATSELSTGFTGQGLPTRQPLPDHVVYRILFRKAIAFNERAKTWDAQGKNGDVLRSLIKRRVQMGNAEAQFFDRVAAEHQQEIKFVLIHDIRQPAALMLFNVMAVLLEGCGLVPKFS